MKRPLIVTSDYVVADAQSGSLATRPVTDYVEITQHLQGHLLGYERLDARWSRFRTVEKSLKLDVGQALLATRQLTRHNAVLSTSEKIAMPLAALLQLTQQTVPHLVIAHKFSSIMKKRLFRVWPLYQHFSRIIFLCQAQRRYAVHQLGIPENKVNFVYDSVDHHFFRPENTPVEDYVLAVGQEQRDYKTLIEALDGTGLKLIICGSSPWSTHRLETRDSTVEVKVVKNISYLELKSLYARARLIVIPLFDSNYAAGVNAALETMAMGKPMIVTRSVGIVDYLTHDETGRFVSPGQVNEMREAILELWHDPAR